MRLTKKMMPAWSRKGNTIMPVTKILLSSSVSLKNCLCKLNLLHHRFINNQHTWMMKSRLMHVFDMT
jgi:hypothetical protein